MFAHALTMLWQVEERVRREDGQTMTEYALVLALIAVAIVAALAVLTPAVNSAITKVANLLPKA